MRWEKQPNIGAGEEVAGAVQLGTFALEDGTFEVAMDIYDEGGRLQERIARRCMTLEDVDEAVRSARFFLNNMHDVNGRMVMLEKE